MRAASWLLLGLLGGCILTGCTLSGETPACIIGCRVYDVQVGDLPSLANWTHSVSENRDIGGP